MAPDIEYHKAQYELHDGETILRMFSDDIRETMKDGYPLSYAHLPINYILRELGIKTGMKRDEICEKLNNIIKLKKLRKLEELAKEEASINPDLKDEFIENVTPFPGMEKRYKEKAVYDIARNRILAVLVEVKNFCEDKKEIKAEPVNAESDYDYVD